MSQTANNQQSQSPKILEWVIWGICIFAIAVAILGPISGQETALAVMFLSIPFAIIHGGRRYGGKTIFIFLVVTWVISTAFENLSIEMGFPFGNYYYNLPGKLFNVPVLVGFCYVGLGYLSWTVASTLLNNADAHMDWRKGWANQLNTFLLPIISGGIMTMWDVTNDHLASTIGHRWIWEDGGGFFGVPYTNYLGWWFVTWAMFQAFSVYFSWKQSTSNEPEKIVGNRGGLKQLPAVLMYGSLGLSYITYFCFADKVGTVTDAVGEVWKKSDLIEASLILCVFTVIPVALLAAGKIWRGDLSEK